MIALGEHGCTDRVVIIVNFIITANDENQIRKYPVVITYLIGLFKRVTWYTSLKVG